MENRSTFYGLTEQKRRDKELRLNSINSDPTDCYRSVHRIRIGDEIPQHQNERLLALALEATDDGIWLWRIPTGEAYFSPRYYTMLGYEPDELPAHYVTWDSLLHPDDLKKTQAIIRKHIENKSEKYEVEFRLQTKSGNWLWILGRGKVVEWDDDGHAICAVGSHVNIDTRKRAEQRLADYKAQLENMVAERTLALKQASSLLEATFNAIPDILGVQDNQHHMIRFNSVIEYLRDITPAKMAEAENRRLNEQLLQTHKMESLSTLAGGIAHDFNNLLMGIQGHVSLMSVDMDPFTCDAEHVKAIEKYIQSATDLTKQLLGLARGGKYEAKPINLNALVRDSAALFGRTRKELQINTNTMPGPLTVEADKRQIERVLTNIYINACQAMPDGGELYLETTVVEMNAADCKPYQVAAGRYAKVSITDSGIGMNAATLRRIFDPFFTTKKKGRGTGLGLASAYGIIRNHSGFLTVHSEVGRGTTFNIYLPASDKEVDQDE